MLVNLNSFTKNQCYFQVLFYCKTDQEVKLLKYCIETSKRASNYRVGLEEQRKKNHVN